MLCGKQLGFFESAFEVEANREVSKITCSKPQAAKIGISSNSLIVSVPANQAAAAAAEEAEARVDMRTKPAAITGPEFPWRKEHDDDAEVECLGLARPVPPEQLRLKLDSPDMPPLEAGKPEQPSAGPSAAQLEMALLHGVHQHGERNWHEIREDTRYPFDFLSVSNLKDMWTTLQARADFGTAQQQNLRKALQEGVYGPQDFPEQARAQRAVHGRRVAEARSTLERIVADGGAVTFGNSVAHSVCALCLRQRSDTDPLCGPYRDAKSKSTSWSNYDKFMCHRSCLLWSRQVKVRPNSGHMRHVVDCIRSSMKRLCLLCGLRGASTICSFPSCDVALHLSCANESPYCALDCKNKGAFCTRHSRGSGGVELLVQDVTKGDEGISTEASNASGGSVSGGTAKRSGSAVDPNQEGKEQRAQKAVIEVQQRRMTKTEASRQFQISVKFLSKRLEEEVRPAATRRSGSPPTRHPHVHTPLTAPWLAPAGPEDQEESACEPERPSSAEGLAQGRCSWRDRRTSLSADRARVPRPNRVHRQHPCRGRGLRESPAARQSARCVVAGQRRLVLLAPSF